MLEVRSISKSFPGVKALDEVSVSFRPGTIHALLGENGAGKSTLMKILCGIYGPDEGEMFLDGQQLVSCGTPSTRCATASASCTRRSRWCRAPPSRKTSCWTSSTATAAARASTGRSWTADAVVFIDMVELDAAPRDAASAELVRGAEAARPDCPRAL